MTSRAYVLPLPVCLVMLLKMDPESSGDGPVATSLLTLLNAAGVGSLGVRTELLRFLQGLSLVVENISSRPEGAGNDG